MKKKITFHGREPNGYWSVYKDYVIEDVDKYSKLNMFNYNYEALLKHEYCSDTSLIFSAVDSFAGHDIYYPIYNVKYSWIRAHVVKIKMKRPCYTKKQFLILTAFNYEYLRELVNTPSSKNADVFIII